MLRTSVPEPSSHAAQPLPFFGIEGFERLREVLLRRERPIEEIEEA
jgi:hypothetical protein